MIELQNLTIHSGSFRLSNLQLSIPSACYSVLMGGTGQGKTTILEAICGLRPVASGQVLLDGRDITTRKPAERNVGYVPQDLALFPTMTVREHLEFALRIRRFPEPAIRARAAELAGELGIEPLLARRTQGLSGGESQRVALGRALSFQPRILLLDEPLNALDESTRDRLCELLRRIQKDHGLSILHVTHSRIEARSVADKLFVLEAGSLSERPLSHLDAAEESTDDPQVANRIAAGTARREP